MKICRAVSIACIISIIGSSSVWAAESAVTDLLFEKAVEQAIKNSNAYIALQESDKLNEITSDNLYNQLSSYFPPSGEFVAESADLSLYTSLIANQISKATNEIDKTTQKEKIEFSMRKLFYAIQNAEKALDLYDQSLAIAKKELDIMKLKAELGKISQNDYDTAVLSYNHKVKDRADKALDIENSYYTLGSLIGKKGTNQYNLIIDAKEYEEMPESINLDYYATLRASESPDVAKAEKNLEQAEFSLRAHSATGGESYSSKVIRANQASRAIGEAKQTVADNVRNYYNNIITLQANITKNEESLQKKQNDFAIKQTQFNLGKITELDLINAEYDIVLLEQTIKSQKLDHELLTYQFQKPYLV